MPLPIEPGGTYRVVLASDQAKEPAEQPAFIFKHATARQWREIAAARAAMAELPTIEQLDGTIGLVKRTLVNWEGPHMPPFDPAALDEIIGPFEGAELLSAVINQGQLDTEKKRNSDSSP